MLGLLFKYEEASRSGDDLQILQGTYHTIQGHIGEHQGGSGGRGSKKKHGQEPLLCFCWKKWAGQAKIWVGLGLATLNNFSGLWSIGVLPLVW